MTVEDSPKSFIFELGPDGQEGAVVAARPSAETLRKELVGLEKLKGYPKGLKSLLSSEESSMV